MKNGKLIGEMMADPLIRPRYAIEFERLQQWHLGITWCASVQRGDSQCTHMEDCA